MFQFRDKHGWHSIKRCTAFLRDSFESLQRTEMWRQQNHRGAMCYATEVAKHHAKAMIEWNWYTQAILVCEPQYLSNPIAIIQNIMVREHCTLGKTCRTRCVLDVYHVVKIQFSLSFRQIPGTNPLRAGQQFLPRSEERRVGKECRSRWSP